MPDRLTVLGHALREGHLMFRDRAALDRHGARLAARQVRWLLIHSPGVARRFREAGLGPGEWQRLPPTGKAEMMAHFDLLNTRGLRLEEVLRVARRAEETRNFTPTVRSSGAEITVGLSSGTSGTRGVFVVSRAERLRWAGTVLRHLLPCWPQDLIRHHRIAFVLRAEGGLYRSVQGKRLAFHFLDLLRPVDQLAAELTRLDPTLVIGPPSVLRALLAAGARARPARVVSVAEVLEDDDRAVLERGFEGVVVQVYQATEGLLALPCTQGHLHLNEVSVHFDLEPVGGGLVRPVISDLYRRTQPVFRHRLDDLLVMAEGECACGLASRRVARVSGRQDDAFQLPGPGGSLITVWPDFVRAAMNCVPDLAEYRVEQVGARALHLQLNPLTPAVAAAALHELRAAVERSGVPSSALEFRCLPLTAPVPGHKRRRVLRTWRPGERA